MTHSRLAALARRTRTVLVTLSALALARTTVGAQSATAQAQQAVLVTGASSGIGRAITERLAASGYFVYAGARSPKDLEELGKIKNVQSVRLDVTVPSDIAAAVATVTKAGRGLRAVVNNAGVVVVAPLVELEEKDLDFIFGVNVYGPYRITKAFAPLLIESKGRVVNISSLNGIVASPMIGAYSMSKHAVEAFGDGLAAELGRFGVRVSLIEPGNYGTDIGRNLMSRMDTSVFRGSRFEAQWRSTVTSMSQFEKNPSPEPVANAVLDAISSATPRARYLVVPAANQSAITLRTLMDHLVQMNDGQAFALDREALIKMLDEAIARNKR